MATKLSKPVVREVKATEPRSLRPFVVTLDSHVIRIRLKRGSDEYILPYERLYFEAAKLRAMT